MRFQVLACSLSCLLMALASALGGEPASSSGLSQVKPLVAPGQRVVIVMLDGFGPDYFEKSEMPFLKEMAAKGFSKTVRGVMPSVTNVNNASLCCGAWPSEHGITGNSYYDLAKGRAEYMENADSLRMNTIFQRASARGVESALISAKKKTIALFSRGTEIAITAETPTQAEVDKYGPAQAIYSREINYWVMNAAIDMLENRRDLGLLFIHTTDYPMHTWPPEASESKEHLSRVDSLLEKAVKACAGRGIPYHGRPRNEL